MRILVVSDAWLPQTNGVVQCYLHLLAELEALGHEPTLIGPDRFRTVPLPTYSEIRLALVGPRGLRRHVEAFAPEAVHIATEGPLGIAARTLCRRQGLPFTTAFHTRFPVYLSRRHILPERWGDRLQRGFHEAAVRTMVSTEGLAALLREKGYGRLAIWSRGVDVGRFRPAEGALSPPPVPLAPDLPRPIHLFVGRIAVEKDIEIFLDLPLPGSKLVVGDGPDRRKLEARYPQAHFVGAKYGDELVDCYRASDVFVFPSRSETLGFVLMEALACGLPVAAFPVLGPSEVVGESGAGVLDWDLAKAAEQALEIPRAKCRERALDFSWQRSAVQFVENLEPLSRRSSLGNGV